MNDLERRRSLCRNLLRPAVGRCVEAGAQHVVVVDDCTQRPLQAVRIDRFGHFQQDGLIPMMGMREVLGEEPLLDGREEDRSGDAALFGPGDRRVGKMCGQLGDGGMLEKLAGGEPQPHLLSAGHDVGDENGIAADFEEIIVDANVVAVEGLPPEREEKALHRRGPGNQTLGRGGRGRGRAESGRGRGVDQMPGDQWRQGSRELHDRGVWRCGQIFQQGEEVIDHALNGLSLPEVGAVLERSLRPAIIIGDGQKQVIFRPIRIQRQGLQGEIGQMNGGDHVLVVGQSRLKDGGDAQVARGLHRIHHQFEGRFGMGKGVPGDGFCPGQKRPKAGGFIQMQAQGQGVDEQPDEGFQLGAGAVGCGGADDHVILMGVAGQERGKCAPKRHERRGARISSQSMEPGQKRFGNGEAHHVAGAGFDGRAREVGGQVEKERRAGQMFSPEGQFLIQAFARKPSTLPVGVIRILDGQVGQEGVGISVEQLQFS